MRHDFEPRRRRSIRLKGYDYAQAGAYFVTICAHGRECLFGDVPGGEARLNECGELIEACWNDIPSHFLRVQLDAFVIMPNHVHGILHTLEPHSAATVGARHAVPLPGNAPHRQAERFSRPVVGSIPTIVRSVKSATTRRINERRGTPGVPIWQRNYYEHIIRDEASLNRIRQYIVDNPARWASDPENPQVVAPEPVQAWRA